MVRVSPNHMPNLSPNHMPNLSPNPNPNAHATHAWVDGALVRAHLGLAGLARAEHVVAGALAGDVQPVRVHVGGVGVVERVHHVARDRGVRPQLVHQRQPNRVARVHLGQG